MKRVLLTSLTLVTLLVLMSGAVSAADRIICDFTDGRLGALFEAGENTRAVIADSHEISASQLAPRECLEVAGRSLDVDVARSVDVTFAEPLDLSDYRTFAYNFYAVEYANDPYANYYTHITLYSSDGSSIENIISVSAGRWSRAGLNIGSWQGRRSIVSAKISLMISTTVDGYYSSSFYIDDISATDEINKTLAKRFLFDRFSVNNASAYQTESELTIVTTSSGEAELAATLFISPTEWETDSLRLRILSEGISSVTVTYPILGASSLTEEKSYTIKLIQDGELHSYYVPIGDISSLTKLSFKLPAEDGFIELHSIAPVSTFTPDKYTTCGSVSTCRITDSGDGIRFAGEVGREEALANQNGTILIYAIEPGCDFDESMLWSGTLLMSSPMTTKFDLTVPLENHPGLESSRFAVVSRRADGSAVLVGAPFHVDEPGSLAAETVEPNFGAKGAVSEDISLIGNLGADTTILEVDVAEVFGSRLHGQSREYCGKLYYFNEETLDALEVKISALHGDGLNILLRLTGWSESFAANLSRAYIGEGGDYSSYNSTPDGDDYLAALSDYLAERFFKGGRADGIILGSCENILSGEKGSDSLGAIAKRLARDMRIIYTEIVTVNSAARVYLSISDALTVELATGEPEIGADELLPAICELTKAGGSFDWGISVEQNSRIASDTTRLILPSESDILIEILRDSGVYDTRLIFCDFTYQPDKQRLSDMVSRMVMSTYSALFGTHIDSYFIAFPDGYSYDSFAEMVSAIDTVSSENDPETIADLALVTLDAMSWKELIPSYDSRRLSRKRVEQLEASDVEPTGVKGSIDYYTFDNYREGGFEPGYYCSKLTKADGKLTARLDSSLAPSGSAAYLGIVHRFDFPETLAPTPILAVTLGISDVVPVSAESVRAIITFMGENSRAEYVTTLVPNETKTVYVDISGYDKLDDVTGISIRLDGSDASAATLTVERLAGLSTEYNDESLESVIADERAKKRQTGASGSYVNYVWIAGGVLVAVATAITVVLLSRKREEDDDEAE